MRHFMPLLAAAAIVLSTVAAYAGLCDQLFKLLPADGAAGDQFSYAVAINGTTAIVGAMLDDAKGTDSGSAYLFDTTTGEQISKLVPRDGAAEDLFGRSVSISGDTVIVGADWDDDNGRNSGSVYLFDATTGRQIAKLLPDDGAKGDRFGGSVAISGTTAIVGATNDEDNGEYSGAAYLFDTATGRQIAKLLANDGAPRDQFGWSVAISGDTAIVGARSDDDNGDDSGSAYLFDAATGRQIAKLLPDDGAAHDGFGFSMAIDGAVLIVAAFQDSDNGHGSGSAYLFDADTGKQLAKILPDDGAAEDVFGYAVGINGTTAIVGAYRHDDNGDDSGSAYVFDITDPGNPQQIAKLLANDGATRDNFGWSVAISGHTAIVGAVLDGDNGRYSGSAYLFDTVRAPCPGDLNCDGSIDIVDVEPFLLALIDPSEYETRYEDCDISLADLNEDGSIDPQDVEPFIELLLGP